jgi:hypothetical protein
MNPYSLFWPRITILSIPQHIRHLTLVGQFTYGEQDNPHLISQVTMYVHVLDVNNYENRDLFCYTFAYMYYFVYFIKSLTIN